MFEEICSEQSECEAMRFGRLVGPAPKITATREINLRKG
jgi:hypothetical protein